MYRMSQFQTFCQLNHTQTNERNIMTRNRITNVINSNYGLYHAGKPDTS